MTDAREGALKHVFYIHYLVLFKKNMNKTQM